MAAQQMKQEHVARKHLDDEALAEEGTRLLADGLGLAVMVRFMRLVAGGRDDFEDIRAAWPDMTLDEVLAATREHRRP